MMLKLLMHPLGPDALVAVLNGGPNPSCAIVPLSTGKEPCAYVTTSDMQFLPRRKNRLASCKNVNALFISFS